MGFFKKARKSISKSKDNKLSNVVDQANNRNQAEEDSLPPSTITPRSIDTSIPASIPPTNATDTSLPQTTPRSLDATTPRSIKIEPITPRSNADSLLSSARTETTTSSNKNPTKIILPESKTVIPQITPKNKSQPNSKNASRSNSATKARALSKPVKDQRVKSASQSKPNKNDICASDIGLPNSATNLAKTAPALNKPQENAVQPSNIGLPGSTSNLTKTSEPAKATDPVKPETTKKSEFKKSETSKKPENPVKPLKPLKNQRRLSASKPKNIDKKSAEKLYIPPSKLLKHFDKSKASTVDSHTANQVKRLLKQNTQDLLGGLPHDVRRAFETLFDRIDVTDSGGITGEEIQQMIRRHTGKLLSLQQVKNVLTELDVKGTGDIEFDEFIFMLSQPSNYVRLLNKRELKGLVNKETQKILGQTQKDTSDESYVFFQALRNATKQDSMTALRTFYKNRLKKLNDHVIHDWSAGQRCIGLSDQEMLKRYETIQGELLRQRVNFCKDNSYKTSPYARPLEWGVMNLREAIIARRKLAQEIKEKKPDPRRVKMSEFVVTPKAVPLPRYVIKKRSPLKRTFNYDQLADIRDKVDNIAKTYYNELKHVAGENSTVVQKELAVDEIRSPTSQANFMHTFEAYCAPFVVSPWIPMPSPTLQASFSPLGRSKLGAARPNNIVVHGRRGYEYQ